MRAIKTALLFLMVPLFACAQQKYIESLKQNLHIATADCKRLLMNLNLYDFYVEISSDSALFFPKEALKVARRNDKKIAGDDALISIAYQLLSSVKFGKSLKCLDAAFNLINKTKSEVEIKEGDGSEFIVQLVII